MSRLLLAPLDTAKVGISVFLIAAASAIAASPKLETISPQKLESLLAGRAARIRDPRTDSDKKQLAQQFQDFIANTAAHYTLVAKYKITDVSWSNNIATFHVHDAAQPRRKERQLKFRRALVLKTQLSKSDAAAIKPNSSLSISAEIEFHPSSLPTIGDTKHGYTVFDVSAHYIPIGYYSARDISYTLNDKYLGKHN